MQAVGVIGVPTYRNLVYGNFIETALLLRGRFYEINGANRGFSNILRTTHRDNSEGILHPQNYSKNLVYCVKRISPNSLRKNIRIEEMVRETNT